MNRYLESTNYMNGIMGLCKWEGTTYVRTNYKFSPNLADRTISRITDKTEYFDKIFYVVEPDGAGLNNGIWYQSSTQLINHIHLLLNLSKEGKRIVKQNGYNYLTSIIRKSTGLSGKQVGAVQQVRSQRALGKYFAKNMMNQSSHHNLFISNTSK